MGAKFEFRTVKIGDLAAEFHDGPHATPPPSGGGPIYLGIQNLTETGHLDLSTIRHIAPADFPRWTKRVTPRPGDVVFTYEASLHRYALIPTGFDGCLGRRLALIRPDPKIVDPKFLLLAMLGPGWRQTVEGRVISGATVDRIPLKDLLSFPLRLPPIREQHRIADLISAFDELIEINEQRIDHLERLTRSFSDGFVRQNGTQKFPGIEASLEPESWEAGRISDLAELGLDGVDPRKGDPSTPYVGLEHFPRRSATLRAWGAASSVKSRKLTFRVGDTLFGKIRPNLHKVVWAPFDGLVSSDAMVFRARPDRPASGVLTAILASDRVIAEATVTANGTKMPRANPDVIMNFPVRIPGPSILAGIDAAIRTWLEEAASLASLIAGLKDTRALLIPRLVTGRLDLSNIDLSSLADGYLHDAR